MTTDTRAALADLLTHPSLWRASRFHEAQTCGRQTGGGQPSGFSRLDRELPDQGWPSHDLTEILLPRTGHGELPLLMPALSRLSHEPRRIVWVQPPCVPYAPALAAAGMQLDRLLLIRPATLRDALWAMEQCLASGACSAVLGWFDALQPVHLRRLHLAGQRGQGWGVLLRPSRHAQAPSPAPLRVEIGALDARGEGMARLDVRLLKRRGRWASDWIRLHWANPQVPGDKSRAAGIAPPSPQHYAPVSGHTSRVTPDARPGA